ncbi:MAG: hypothetical protein Q8N55_00175, partial [bacterium]|nr:hypothetical protein [bacterium]
SANANLLTLLGCFVFTETLGVLFPNLNLKDEKGKTQKAKNFYRCLFRLKSGAHLYKIDKLFREQSRKGLYEHLRSTMAHGFLPVIKKTKDGKIFFLPAIIAKVGVLKERKEEKGVKTPPIMFKDGNIIIMAVNYVNELKNIALDLYGKIFVEKDKIFLDSALSGIEKMMSG